jgi:hypothetical protein
MCVCVCVCVEYEYIRNSSRNTENTVDLFWLICSNREAFILG